jgi:endonuclease/exonuclease/phosphatase family metal-dependent hydrolase
VKNVSRVTGTGLIIIIVLLLESHSLGTRYRGGNEIRIVFYNVENLFDTLDSDLDDDEFLPGSERRWNTYKYTTKLNNISKVLISCSNKDAPDIIGLCEVENKNVLIDLCSETILGEVGYRTLFAQSHDSRGIGVALLYKSTFELVGSEIIYPHGSNDDTLDTRSVLYAELADSFDTLRLFVSHWPSRRGGVSATDKLRQEIAELIGTSVRKLRESGAGKGNIVVMGDLNANPGDEAIAAYLTCERNGSCPGRLNNISTYRGKKVEGSYKYQGRWNMFDQVLIDSSLLMPGNAYSYKKGSFRVLENDNILVDDLKYRGKKPGSTWSGPAYNGLYSDHLPVYFDLIINGLRISF